MIFFKYFKPLLITVLIVLLLPFNVKASSSDVTWLSNGELSFNTLIYNKTIKQLEDEGCFLTISPIANPDEERELNSINSLYALYEWLETDNISIFLNVYDEELNFIKKSSDINFVIPSEYLNYYKYNLVNDADIDNIVITGNETGFKLDLDNRFFFQDGNKIYLNYSRFKDFSINYKKANISFISNNKVIETKLNVEINSNYLVKTLVNEDISITNDNNYLYIKTDNEDYLKGISFIHLYGIDFNNEEHYIISSNITLGNDGLAYDLNSTAGIINDSYTRYDLPVINNKTMKISLYDLKTLLNTKHDFYIIDIYNHDYVTYHNSFVIKHNETPAISGYIPPRTDVK